MKEGSHSNMCWALNRNESSPTALLMIFLSDIPRSTPDWANLSGEINQVVGHSSLGLTVM